MKRLISIAIAVTCLGICLTACNSETASQPNSKTAASAKVPCAMCQGNVDSSAIKVIDGKEVCVNCAEKSGGMQDADMSDCLACNTQVATKDLVEKDGKKICAACASH